MKIVNKTKDQLKDIVNGPVELRKKSKNCVMNRREFLLTSGLTVSTIMISMSIGDAIAKVPAAVATYEKKFIANLSDLKQDEPIDFDYPDDGAYSSSMLVKLGKKAGGGIGVDSDIVAFNYICTHQGNSLEGSYKANDKVLGPCSLHLTTYDLTRYGIFVSGQAYQSLPQILLELDGDKIYAVGVFGLIYGRYNNLEG